MSFSIEFGQFLGADKKTDELMLREGVCVDSVDQDLETGDLAPLRDVGAAVAVLPQVQQQRTIWRMDQATRSESNYWLSFAGVVSLVRGFEADDSNERTYFSGDGPPKWTSTPLALGGGAGPYPRDTRLLGVPGPAAAPAVSVAVAGATGTEVPVQWAYTYVTDLGWESAPSPPSASIVAKPGTTFHLSGFAAPAAGYGIALIRLYKGVYDGAGGYDFFYHREWSALGAAPDAPVGDARAIGVDPLKTEGWRPPPADGHGLKRLWSGILGILSGKALRLCVPYKHYAWPLRYEIGLPAQGVAIGVWGQRAIVLTMGDAVVIAGSPPESMDDEPAQINRPCSSARSVVEFNEGQDYKGVAWASEEGLCWYGDGGFRLLTQGIIPATMWAAMNPASMVAAMHQGRYVCFYEVAGQRLGFELDPKNPSGLFFRSKGYHAVYRDAVLNALFVLDGQEIKRWGVGNYLAAKVRSKLYLLPSPDTVGAIQVIAKAYPVRVRIYADGVLRHTQDVTSLAPIRPPSGWLADAVQFEIEASAGRVIALRAAPSMEALPP